MSINWSEVIAWTVLLSEWSIRLLMLPAIVMGHRAAEALAWMAMIFFQPIPGVALYLLVGRPPLGRDREKKHRELTERLETPERLSPLAKWVVPLAEVPLHRRDFVTLSNRLGRMPLVRGNAASLISDTRLLVDAICAEIDRSSHCVHLLYYIFRCDSTGRRVADALERAAKRGVKCRLLVDAVGSRGMLKSMAPGLKRAGVDVRAALPVRLPRRSLARIDLRNHRKLAVIDGRIAFAGSHNVADPSYGHRKFGAWQDMSARIEGPAVYQLQIVFLEDWSFETNELPQEQCVLSEPISAGEVPMQAAPSGPGYRTDAFRDLMVHAVHESDHRIIMTTPYLVPDEPFLLALRLAAMGGLRVDLIVPERGNHPLVNAAASSFFDELLSAGVHVHLHQDGLLHAKTLTVDDSLAMIGSGNFDVRSFSLNYELNMFMYGPRITGELRALQEHYVAASRELSFEEWNSRPGVRKLADRTARLFGPLL